MVERQATANVIDVPVLIVGAGAAGLTASALLARHGISSLLVEKRRELFIYPKARNLSFRTLEILRGLGLGNQIHAVADRVSDSVVKPALNSSEERLGVDIDAVFSGFDTLSPEPPVQYCPQSKLEPILVGFTRDHGSDVRYGTELVTFTQDESAVTAEVRTLDSDRSQVVRARYLLAADGVHGQTRQTLGVSASGYGALPIYVVFIYFRAPWRHFVPHLAEGDAIQVKNDLVDGIFIGVQGDLSLFVTTYFPSRGETVAQFTHDRCRGLIVAAVGEHIEVDIVDVAPWQPYEQVADQFQTQRVFLVGDAAHTMPPFKAGGANAAIQSAHNLAWKIAAVLHKVAGPELLGTYHDERHPVGVFSARQSLTGPPLAMLHLDEKTPALRDEQEAPMFAVIAGYRYQSAAVVTTNRSPAGSEAALVVDELRGQPGTRVPHAWVHHQGRRVSTLDLIGSQFTLFATDHGSAWISAARSTARALGIPINVYRVGSRGDVIDSEDQWATSTQIESDGALLVRPDDFVAWRTDALPAYAGEQLRAALTAILARPLTGSRAGTAPVATLWASHGSVERSGTNVAPRSHPYEDKKEQ
ncbi:FAD-dependent monooxygenase [Mycolicibacterium chlorophenolicum]|uniref:2,4-dichlorophenol 6-monooxygenase n=1 Tax=Mycolicibacterium chlorophenolicum TaxID=37916 RepID=A0A0J6WMB3_9MYCO|nr:FAD-dependent monooxygenase [Mycolicibacterium chlorophenolicum]KMO83739.1 2,4-dichlorophenol 6-monooxygenase [Mycolicibacterium chlorophenolicum]